MTEHLLEAVTGAVSDAIIVADTAGTIVFWTGGAQRSFGWTAQEAIGQPLTLIVPDAWRERHDTAYARASGGAELHLMGRPLELEGLRKDGTTFPIELTLGRDSAPRRGFFVGVVRDITQRKLAAAELERSLAELEQFASIASHDLAAPLQIVAGYLDLLRRRPELSAEALGYVEAADGSVTDMLELISALLRYARIGAVGPELEDIDVDALVAEIEPGLGSPVPIEHHDLPTLTSDPTLLRQALQNLLANAVRYAAGAIVVEATRTDGGWRLAVGDDGPGIPQESRERVLEMFVRGEDGGTGLGLAIARRAAERLGGTLEVGQSRLGGAELAIVLPTRR